MTFSSWEKFEDLLYKLSKQPGYKPKKGEKIKNASPLISPAIYSNGSTRSNQNVLSWQGWSAIDVDDYEEPFNEVISKYTNWYFICYSSASSTKKHPKFRLVFPLSASIENKKIKHFWYALNKELNNIGDAQTKDLSRMYYVPAQYPNAYNFIFTNKGNIINPFFLMQKHEYVESNSVNSILDSMPDDMKNMFLKRKEESLTNTNITWSSYRDCPFVSKEMLAKYQSITETGWYHCLYTLMVSIASRAIIMKYPITPSELEILIREIDRDTGNWYEKRKINLEARRAVEFALINSKNDLQNY